MLGSKAYIKKINDSLHLQNLSPEIVGQKKIEVLPNISEIIIHVAKYYNISTRTICKIQPGKNNLLRKVAILLCRELGKCELQEIAKAMGGVKYTAISNSISKARDESAVINAAAVIKEKVCQMKT